MCWSPLAAPAVSQRAARDLREPDTAADGPEQSAGAARGSRNTLPYLEACTGLEGNVLMPFSGWDAWPGARPSFHLDSCDLCWMCSPWHLLCRGHVALSCRAEASWAGSWSFVERDGRKPSISGSQDAASGQAWALLVATQMGFINLLLSCLAAELGPGSMRPSMPLFPLLHRR